MATEFDLALYRTVSNSANPTLIGPASVGDVEGDILLIVRPVERRFEFIMSASPRGAPQIGEAGVSRRDAVNVFARSQECRRAWDEHIISLSDSVPAEEGGERNKHPFQEDWNFAYEPDLLTEAAPQLALAGDKLFTLIFEREGDQDLYRLAAMLRRMLQRSTRHICISSESFFLPWGLLYTHPVPGERLESDGSNWNKEGFWGYQHIVQHMPKIHTLNEVIEPELEGVRLSLNVDERIVKDLDLPVIDKHFHYISSLAGPACIRRALKSELRKAFQEGVARLERILYFYCHGHGATTSSGISLEEPNFSLTDACVSASDLEQWSGATQLPTRPLVFINACQGGQMTTMFYQSFAVELLKQGAIGLLGAQVDIPAVFAAEYARRIFGELLTKGNQVRLGSLLRDTNQMYWNTYSNPLGLVYSLYRGVNCFINRPPA
jgi:hypothetical protein